MNILRLTTLCLFYISNFSSHLVLASLQNSVFQERNNSLENYKISTPIIDVLVQDKLYRSTGQTCEGKTIYFGMEFVDKNNLQNWRSFRQSSDYRSKFYFSSKLYSKDSRQTYFENSSYTQSEYDIFCDNIIEKANQRTADENSSIRENLSAAIGAFEFYSDNGYYIAYITTKPITDYFKHTEQLYPSLKDYRQAYEDLLICVRCKDIFNTVVYNNRGIFKGLDCLLNKSCKGLALKLHAFTAAVFEAKGKTHMSVAPLPNMYDILKSQISSNKLLVRPNIPKELDHFAGRTGSNDIECIIPIEALKVQL